MWVFLQAKDDDEATMLLGLNEKLFCRIDGD